MKVTLIAPRWQKGLWSVKMFKMPPMGILVLATVTPKDVDVELIDENITPVPFAPTDLVGISAMTSSATRAYEIADKYREMGSRVVLGGIHPSMLPQEAIQHADCVVIGEADETWPILLEDFRRGELKQFYKADTRPDIRTLPPLRRDLLTTQRYIFPNTIQTARGCPYDCDFCSVSQFNARRIRTRSIEQIVEEISIELEREKHENIRSPKWRFARWLTRRFIFFTDDNIVANHQHAMSLFQALIPLRIRWGSQCSIDIAQNEALLKAAAESGCRALFIGFESLRQEALEEIHKGRTYKVQEYEELIHRIHSYGIAVEASFVFGFDMDDKDVFRRTVDFCRRNNIQVCQFSALTPLPGTRLFQRLEQEGRILTRDWSQYDVFHAVFRPKQMTAEELQQGLVQAYRDFYSIGSIAKRIAPMMSVLRFYTLASFGINLDFHGFKF